MTIERLLLAFAVAMAATVAVFERQIGALTTAVAAHEHRLEAIEAALTPSE
jgi:hypothetical protein